MTGMVKTTPGASSASSLTWKTIEWDHVITEVKRLQDQSSIVNRPDFSQLYLEVKAPPHYHKDIR